MTHRGFLDWFNRYFGFSYGMGEEPILDAFRIFFEMCGPDGYGRENTYDFSKLEERIGPAVTWMLINHGCNCGWIEYGTSPRFGWLEGLGLELKGYFKNTSMPEMLKHLRRDWTLNE